MIVIDAYLLDYGFQPIVNRFAKHPLDFALSTAIGGSIMLSVAVSFVVRPDNMLSASMALMAIFCQGFAIGSLRVAMERLRQFIVPGVRNPLRLILLRLRLASIVMMLWLAITVTLLFGIGLIPCLFALGGTLWTACFYFESCDCPPYKPKRVRRPAVLNLRLADI